MEVESWIACKSWRYDAWPGERKAGARRGARAGKSERAPARAKE
jgi:hypothetical protein